MGMYTVQLTIVFTNQLSWHPLRCWTLSVAAISSECPFLFSPSYLVHVHHHGFGQGHRTTNKRKNCRMWENNCHEGLAWCVAKLLARLSAAKCVPFSFKSRSKTPEDTSLKQRCMGIKFKKYIRPHKVEWDLSVSWYFDVEEDQFRVILSCSLPECCKNTSPELFFCTLPECYKKTSL